MTRLSFVGILVSISILAAAGQVSAITEDLTGLPRGLTDVQKVEWQIGNIAGMLEMCGYNSKASQLSSFMKKSPHFRKGIRQVIQYDKVTGCRDFDKIFKSILGEKEQWEQYLDVTYPDE